MEDWLDFGSHLQSHQNLMGEKVMWDKLSHVGRKILPLLKDGINSPI